jgi:hypothetical protein
MVCIVSAYYKIPSKKPHDWYTPYLLRWFRSVRAESIHFFTTQDVIDEISSQVDVSHITFHCIPFSELTANAKGSEFWERQYARDAERYHSPQLGMIWYEKRHFVRRAIELDKKADVFIWCDAGCIRNDVSENAARLFGTRNRQLNDDKLHLQLIQRIQLNEFYRYPDKAVACAIIAGNRKAWEIYTQLYEDCLVEYDIINISGISDQYVTIRCILKKFDSFYLYLEHGAVDEWFKFLEIL